MAKSDDFFFGSGGFEIYDVVHVAAGEPPDIIENKLEIGAKNLSGLGTLFEPMLLENSTHQIAHTQLKPKHRIGLATNGDICRIPSPASWPGLVDLFACFISWGGVVGLPLGYGLRSGVVDFHVVLRAQPLGVTIFTTPLC